MAAKKTEERDDICIHCGAPAGRLVFPNRWQCKKCGKWQDWIECPACGTNVPVYRLRDHDHADALTALRAALERIDLATYSKTLDPMEIERICQESLTVRADGEV